MVILRKWYNSDDRKARILTKWQSMTLLDAMAEDPTESEVTVFRNFVAKLMSLQNQLDITYHTDQFLRDRLLTSVNIPAIQSSLRDRLPRTSQQAINRIANQLSAKSRSAGTNAVCIVDDEDEVMYSLGKQYGGDARSINRKPWFGKNKRDNNSNHSNSNTHNSMNKNNNTNYNNNGYNSNNGYNNNNRINGRYKNNNTNNNYRRLSPSWMKGVKGCFVCGGDHMANTRHNTEDVTEAINRLKANHPSALLTVEDLSNVMDMVKPHDDNNNVNTENVRWVEDDAEDSDLSFMTIEEAKKVALTLHDNKTNHCRNYVHKSKENIALTIYNNNNNISDEVKFNGVVIDTAANRRSVMCKSQYHAYEKEFGRRVRIRPPRRDLRGIGGKKEVCGEVTIQIPFTKLNLIIDVDFSIIEDETPSLLSNKDMITNGLDISLPGRYIYIGKFRQPLMFENYFLI